jgi:hypothetical protein
MEKEFPKANELICICLKLIIFLNQWLANSLFIAAGASIVVINDAF